MTIHSKFNIGEEVYYFLFGKVKRGKIRQISVKQSGISIDIENSVFPVSESDVSYTDGVFESKIKEYQIMLLKDRIDGQSSEIQHLQEKIKTAQLAKRNAEIELRKLVKNTEKK